MAMGSALLLLLFFVLEISGQTTTLNISSASSSVQFVGNWRSDLAIGFYEAYSNESVASATLKFEGVGVQYIAYRKYDRGLSGLKLDGLSTYTIDLYDNSGYTQPEQVIWQSPVLPYGEHSITLYQLGPDARFGVYPYLISETWVVIYPTDIPNYTATEVHTTGSPQSTSIGGASRATPHDPNIAAIAGGVVGSVVAVCLLGFLLYLWRKDKRLSEEAEAKREERRRARELGMDQDGNGGMVEINHGRDYRGSHDDERYNRQQREQNYANEGADYSSKSSTSSNGIRKSQQPDSQYSPSGISPRSYHPSEHSRVPFHQASYEALSLTGQIPSPDSLHSQRNYDPRARGGGGGSVVTSSSRSYPYHGRDPIPEV